MTHTMNYAFLDLSVLGLQHKMSRTGTIHNQSSFQISYYAEDDKRIMLSYGSPSIPSNKTGEDEVDVYVMPDEHTYITLTVAELTVHKLATAMKDLGYEQPMMRYRATKIDSLLS